MVSWFAALARRLTTGWHSIDERADRLHIVSVEIERLESIFQYVLVFVCISASVFLHMSEVVLTTSLLEKCIPSVACRIVTD